MKLNITITTALILGLIFSTNVAAETLVIPGTGDGVAVLEAVGGEFQKKTGISVEIPKSIGSGGGVKAAGSEKVNLARVAREIKDKEKHFGLSYTPVFQIPTVFLVNSSVGIENLTEQQVLDIFSGKVTNWKDVGGSDGEIIVVRREEGDSSLGNLQKTFPGFKDITLTPTAFLAKKTYLMVAQIANRENTISFGPLDVALKNNLKILKINNKEASSAGYPYYGTIGLVYKDNNLTDISQKYLAFITSAEAYPAIKNAGGNPLK